MLVSVLVKETNMIMSRCEDCNHRNICKYKDEYDKVIREITVKVPEPFTLTLNCKHYYSTSAYLSYQLNNCSNSTASSSDYLQIARQ